MTRSLGCLPLRDVAASWLEKMSVRKDAVTSVQRMRGAEARTWTRGQRLGFLLMSWAELWSPSSLIPETHLNDKA